MLLNGIRNCSSSTAGYSEPQAEEQVQDPIQDFKRIEFHKMYMSSLAQAIR